MKMKMEKDESGNGMKMKNPYALHWEQILSPTLDSGEPDSPPPEPVAKKSRNDGVDSQMDERVDSELGMKTESEVREAIARYKKNLQIFGNKLADKGEKIKETIRRLEEELQRRNELQSKKEDSTTSPDRLAGNKSSECLCNLQSGVTTNALIVNASEHDSMTDEKMQKIVNELVNVGISETDIGTAAELCYSNPVKVKVLFALPSHLRKIYVSGFLRN